MVDTQELEPSPATFQGVHQQEDGSEGGAGEEPGTPIWPMGVPSSDVSAVLNAHPIQSFLTLGSTQPCS